MKTSIITIIAIFLLVFYITILTSSMILEIGILSFRFFPAFIKKLKEH